MSLSQTATTKEKPYTLCDEKGLFLLVTPNGGKWWRCKYRFGGKKKLLLVLESIRVAVQRAATTTPCSLHSNPDTNPKETHLSYIRSFIFLEQISWHDGGA